VANQDIQKHSPILSVNNDQGFYSDSFETAREKNEVLEVLDKVSVHSVSNQTGV
jgi:hypothetical protein